MIQEQVNTLQHLINTLIEFFVNYSFQVLGAVVVLGIGFALAHWLSELALKVCEKKKFDITLSKFLAGTVKIIILGFVLVVALGKFGITIAPFVAALSAAVFGATYAIQGPLSNYGAGLSIILGRPFVVGDTITVAGVSGVVEDVKLAATTLVNEDGVRITVPNKHIVGENLYNSKANKVVESLVGISYASDPEKAISVIQRTLVAFKEVTTNPPPQIGIQAFGDSSINVGYRYWVPTKKYFQTSYAVNLAVYKAFESAQIEIPFPQREVRLISQPSSPSSLSTST